MNKLSEKLHNASEMAVDITRSLLPWTWNSMSQIRGFFGMPRMGLRFWPTAHPSAEGTVVNYDVTRQLYRNEGANPFGASFAKPIVDLQVAFMGAPRISTDNEDLTAFLNKCVGTVWVDEIQQMFRDAIRDSKCIVRIHKPDILDPLMTIDEAEHCTLEVLPPERVDIERDVRNRNIIERVVVHHKMIFVKDDGDIPNGRDPITEEHEVLEIVTRDRYRFFDQTTSQWLDDMETPNRWNACLFLEVFNEWDSSLQGGQSDLETVIAFINAFHDVVTQGLQAHAYHSTPKVVMNLEDVLPFVKNNFPDAIDPTTGQILANAEISWRGREILFLQIDDKIEFLEAVSVLGDTKTLAEFLIDCICIASQTPEWAFMRVDSGSANSDRNAQTVPFIKKIERKRRNFQKPLQQLCKMVMLTRDLIPELPTISWDMVREDDQVVHMQALQQVVMAIEIARQRGNISDETYQGIMQTFLPLMRSPAEEKSEPDALPEAPISQPAIGSGA